MERAKAGKELSRADMQLLERLKSDTARMSLDAESGQKKSKRGRPTELRRLAERIERLILEKLLERQQRGEKLTAADYAFLEKIKQATLEKAGAVKAPETKLPLGERLQASKEDLFDSLTWVAAHSKSRMARVQAAHELKQWANEEYHPLPLPKLVRARPQDVKVGA